MDHVKHAVQSTTGQGAISLGLGMLTLGATALVGKFWKDNFLKFWELGLLLAATDTALTFTALQLCMPHGSTARPSDDPTPVQQPPTNSHRPVETLQQHSPDDEPVDDEKSDEPAPGGDTPPAVIPLGQTSPEVPLGLSLEDQILRQVLEESRQGGQPTVQEEKDAELEAAVRLSLEQEHPPEVQPTPSVTVTAPGLPENAPGETDGAATPPAEEDPKPPELSEEERRRVVAEATARRLAAAASNPPEGGTPAAEPKRSDPVSPAKPAKSASRRPLSREERQRAAEEERKRILERLNKDRQKRQAQGNNTNTPPESNTSVPTSPAQPAEDQLAERRRAMAERAQRAREAAISTLEPSRHEPEVIRPTPEPQPANSQPTRGMSVGAPARRRRAATPPPLEVQFTKGQSLSSQISYHISNGDAVRAHTGVLTLSVEVLPALSDLGALSAREVVIACDAAPTPEQLRAVADLAQNQAVSLMAEELPLPTDGSLTEEQLQTLIKACPSLKRLALSPSQADAALPQLKNLGRHLDQIKLVGDGLTAPKAKDWVANGYLDEVTLDLRAYATLSGEQVIAFNRARGITLNVADNIDLSQIRTSNLSLVRNHLVPFGDETVREQYTGPVAYSPLLSSDGRVLIRQGTTVIDSETAYLILQWIATDTTRSVKNMPNAADVQKVHLDDIPLANTTDVLRLRDAFPNAMISFRRCHGVNGSNLRNMDRLDGESLQTRADRGRMEAQLHEAMLAEFNETGQLDLFVKGTRSESQAAAALIACFEASDSVEQKAQLQRQCIDYLCRMVTPETIDLIWQFANDQKIGVLKSACYLAAHARQQADAENYACDPTSRECSDFVIVLDGHERPVQRWNLSISARLYQMFVEPTGQYYLEDSVELQPDRPDQDRAMYFRCMHHIIDYLEGSFDLQRLSNDEVRALVEEANVLELSALRDSCVKKLGVRDYETFLANKILEQGI